MPSDVVFTTEKFRNNFDTQIPEMGRPQTLKMMDGKRISALHALLVVVVVFSATTSLPCLMTSEVGINKFLMARESSMISVHCFWCTLYGLDKYCEC